MKNKEKIFKIGLGTIGLLQSGLLISKLVNPESISWLTTLLPVIITSTTSVAIVASEMIVNTVKNQKNFSKFNNIPPKTIEELEKEKNKPLEYTKYSTINGKNYMETNKIVNDGNINTLINKKYELINLKEILISSTETKLDENYKKLVK